MMLIKYFEDIQAWKESRKLTSHIYSLTKQGTLSKDFGLSNQLQRASISIMANIAEGFGRNSNRDFIRFLNISLSSIYELQSHLYIALDLEYINKQEFEKTYELTKSTAKLIGGFIKYLRKQ